MSSEPPTTDERWLERLSARLAQPRSIGPVEARFGSQPAGQRRYDAPPEGARAAAVLALLYPHHGQWHLPLTLRPSHMADHAGQISLPGGAIEPGETSPQAALREFHEELGGDDCPIWLLGRLSPLYVHHSNFQITPWVGFSRQRPEMRPNPAEVEQLLEIPLAHLLDPANLGSHQRWRDGRPYTAPHFTWQTHRIWARPA